MHTKMLTFGVSHLNFRGLYPVLLVFPGYIDVGDGCWRRNVMRQLQDVGDGCGHFCH